MYKSALGVERDGTKYRVSRDALEEVELARQKQVEVKVQITTNTMAFLDEK